MLLVPRLQLSPASNRWIYELIAAHQGHNQTTHVLPLTVLAEHWQSLIRAHFSGLLPVASQLWRHYQGNLPTYLPISVPVQGQRPAWHISPAVYTVLSQGFPESTVSPQIALPVIMLKGKQEPKEAIVPVNYEARLGDFSQVGRLHAEVLTIGKPDELLAWQLPIENPDFMPRPKATTSLVEKLAVVHRAEQKSCQVVLTTAVSGMGGVGKTELARHYLHHSEDPEYKQHYDRRFWMDASSHSQISIEFRQIGRALHLFEAKASDKEVRHCVHEWLRIHPGWLLVLDNGPAKVVASGFVPRTSPRVAP